MTLVEKGSLDCSLMVLKADKQAVNERLTVFHSSPAKAGLD